MWEIDAAVGMGDLGDREHGLGFVLTCCRPSSAGGMDELVEPFAHRYPRTPTWSRSFGMPARRKV